MKKQIIAFSAAAALALPAAAQPKLTADNIDAVIAAMTLEEKAMLVTGTGMAGFNDDGANNPVVGATRSIVPGAAGTTWPLERLGIPAVVTADGPAGLRIDPLREGDAATYYCTGFPVGTVMASTWNTELVESVGKAMGQEVREYGCDVLLAPALNIHRNPLCGRNFEYYSEDPLLAGKVTAAMVRGVQSNGVGTSIKHFAVNSQETNRMANDARLSARALREIYLRGFEIAVRESDPWTVMSSYNYINGVYASESVDLLTTILRDEWGFKGLVMTDWNGGRNPGAQMHAGNDLLMPGHGFQRMLIQKAVEEGTLSMADLDRSVRRVLELVVRSPRFAGYACSNRPDLEAHAALTRQAATEGMVLLENRNRTLPLGSGRRVALFGTTSYDFSAGGTGSGDVHKAYVVDLRAGLRNAGYTIDEELAQRHADYMEGVRAATPADDHPLSAFLSKPRMPEPSFSEEYLCRCAEANDAAIVTIGRSSGEFADRRLKDDYLLTEREQALLKQVCAVYHAAGKPVVVILNVGGVIETASWRELPDAVLLAWQSGQEGGNSVADVLCGRANPSGRLPMTFAVNYADIPSSKNFPENYVFDLKTAFMPRDGKNECNVDYTRYEEDIYVGYRYFNTFDKRVAYPFGYGLSYTSFDYGTPKVRQRGSDCVVTVAVRNTGDRAGKEVVQLYVAAPKGSLEKPASELRAFAKTRELNPGEVQTVELVVPLRMLASFNESRSAWVADRGEYRMKVGASSRDIRCEAPFRLSKERVERVHDVLAPAEPIACCVK